MNPEEQYYWGKPTASIEWCELKYTHSPYIAEFWNTISSLHLCLLAIIGIALARKYNFGGKTILSYSGLFIVGLGSAAFHGTLLYTSQLLDELPMIYASLFFVYALSDIKNTLFVVGLVVYGVGTTALMLTFRDNPLIHQNLYAILVFYLIGRSAYIAYVLAKSNKDRGNLKYLFFYALLMYGIGFSLWIYERKNCVNGHAIPWVQLHAWWHMFTGTATFVWCNLSAYHAHLLKVKSKTNNLGVAHFAAVPYVYLDIPAERKVR